MTRDEETRQWIKTHLRQIERPEEVEDYLRAYRYLDSRRDGDKVTVRISKINENENENENRLKMKVTFDVPDKFVGLAEATMIAQAKSNEEDLIRNAVAKCKQKDNYISEAEIGEPDKDICQMYLAFAIMAIAVELGRKEG